MMFALSLWRPWSCAIVRGPKSIENRGWWRGSIVGETIAIHGALRFDDDGARTIRQLWPEAPALPSYSPLGIVGVARVAGVIAPGDGEDGYECPVILAGTPGVHVDVDLRWWDGESFGWVLDQRTAIKPVPCKGRQGLWRVPEPLEREVRRRAEIARTA